MTRFVLLHILNFDFLIIILKTL